jgi:hypothetical protein
MQCSSGADAKDESGSETDTMFACNKWSLGLAALWRKDAAVRGSRSCLVNSRACDSLHIPDNPT